MKNRQSEQIGKLVSKMLEGRTTGKAYNKIRDWILWVIYVKESWNAKQNAICKISHLKLFLRFCCMFKVRVIAINSINL